MNKSQLINLVAEDVSRPKGEVRMVIDSLLRIVEQTLAHDEKVLVSGFGIFSVVHVAEHVGRNPRTGEEVRVDARRTVKFRSSMDIK